MKRTSWVLLLLSLAMGSAGCTSADDCAKMCGRAGVHFRVGQICVCQSPRPGRGDE